MQQGWHWILDKASTARLMCVGDVMLDRHVSGVCDRLSPEAPVPILKVSDRIAAPGGAANVALNIAHLGGKCSLHGVVGADFDGRHLVSLLSCEKAIDARLISDTGRPTTRKTRFTVSGTQLLRVDEEQVLPLAGSPARNLLESMNAELEVHAVLVSDYAKGVVGTPVLGMVERIAGRARCPVLIDPKTLPFIAYGSADVIKPNQRELEAETGLRAEEDEEVEQALAQALEQCQAKAIVVTRAGKGASVAERGRAVVHLPAQFRAVSDIAGGGDTMLAAMGIGLAVGAPLAEATQFALASAGIAVSKPGVATVRAAELRRASTRLQEVEKFVPLPVALCRIEAWRKCGLSIGFTNGCFDLLHDGHVKTLAFARGRCDRLVVGINGDASVRRLKGRSRPINTLAARAAVLGALADVDLVIVFSANTPLPLIDAIKPDLLVKGGDYNEADIVGRDIVKGNGGVVLVAPFQEGQSTTSLIHRARRA